MPLAEAALQLVSPALPVTLSSERFQASELEIHRRADQPFQSQKRIDYSVWFATGVASLAGASG